MQSPSRASDSLNDTPRMLRGIPIIISAVHRPPVRLLSFHRHWCTSASGISFPCRLGRWRWSYERAAPVSIRTCKCWSAIVIWICGRFSFSVVTYEGPLLTEWCVGLRVTQRPVCFWQGQSCSRVDLQSMCRFTTSPALDFLSGAYLIKSVCLSWQSFRWLPHGLYRSCTWLQYSECRSGYVMG